MNSSTSAQALSASVSSLKSSLNLLDSSISILDQGISDFPRLSTVLTTTRHFELTPSHSLTLAQQSLASELSPAISTLLNRVESHLDRLERREQALIARAELNEGRLAQKSGANSRSASRAGGRGVERMKDPSLGNDEKAKRLRELRTRKERLGYAVERLGLQSQQRQRQLRMSVSHAGQDFS